MRQIGVIQDEARARRFGDYLLSEGMENEVEAASEGWSVWIHDDDHLEEAQERLTQFLAQPDDPKYVKQSRDAHRIRKEKDHQEVKRRRLYVDVRQRWALGMPMRSELTKVLIGISVIVSLVMFSSDQAHETIMVNMAIGRPVPRQSPDAMEQERFIADYAQQYFVDFTDTPRMYLPDAVRKGEVWRAITPIFMHMSVFHLLFNMFWLWDFGRMIETRKGWKVLLGLVVGIAVISNYAQCVWSSPLFGGMSGVNYGLFGYLWMKGKRQPRDGLSVSDQTVIILMIWLVLCMTGMVGRIANTAHVMGLAAGMLAVLIPHWWAKRKSA